jgi:hypothetical protein
VFTGTARVWSLAVAAVGGAAGAALSVPATTRTRRLLRKRVGAEYLATLCDLGVFMDEPAEPISSDDLDVGVDGVG